MRLILLGDRGRQGNPGKLYKREIPDSANFNRGYAPGGCQSRHRVGKKSKSSNGCGKTCNR